ncbi:PREDICTED: uncharacterized protein LOC105559703 [Vollenhovia emeryi]|uniref:uncharacterized protein LOC105559703 n=1 Tax=Vollenhovia emeryi TaxID=411798 RepID=UPI0005F49E1E|nr:PREDICTED: uncharacterized protein LOC105559703 [Vollenhovia emeryi]
MYTNPIRFYYFLTRRGNTGIEEQVIAVKISVSIILIEIGIFNYLFNSADTSWKAELEGAIDRITDEAAESYCLIGKFVGSWVHPDPIRPRLTNSRNVRRRAIHSTSQAEL